MSSKPIVGKPATTSPSPNSSKSTKSNSSPRFIINPIWNFVGTFLHVALSLFCIYLTPFGRTSTPANSAFTTQLYDLLFVDKIADFDRTFTDIQSSYVGPALLATFTRPFGLIFDDKIRNLIFDKVLPLIEPLPVSIVATAKLYLLETKLWYQLIARALLSVLVALSSASLRHSLSLKFKSASLPRIYTALSLATVLIPLTATNLSSQAFSVILLNLALAALFKQKFIQTFSLLTVNAVIFDSVSGSLLLASSFIAFSSLESFKLSSALTSVILTFPLAGVTTFALDSLFYNKFIWPQGESLYHFINSLIMGRDLKNMFLETISKINPTEIINSKHFANALIILAPALLVFLLGRCNRYSRSMVSLYTINALGNLLLSLTSNINPLNNTVPLLIPLFISASIAVMGSSSFSSSSRSSTITKSLTYFAFFGIVIPALAWSLGRINLEISSSQQYTGEALMALNSKLLKDTKEGVPVRVFIDYDASSQGYSRFIELVRGNQFFYTTNDRRSYDYFIGNPSYCPQDKSMKTFKGYSKIDLKALKTVQVDRIGVFRKSETCVLNAQKPPKLDYTISSPANLPTIISNKFFNSRFSSVKDQRDLISHYLGKFNHKKVSNTMGLIAYLYQSLLEQL